MSYDTWKSTNPADREYDPADREYDEPEECFPEDEVTEVISPLQLEVEALRLRLDTARLLVLAALDNAERGYSMPFARLDSLLTGVLVQCGCAVCGEKFARNDASQLECVRRHGVHASECCLGSGREVQS